LSVGKERREEKKEEKKKRKDDGIVRQGIGYNSIDM